jgi:hypothetical protein
MNPLSKTFEMETIEMIDRTLHPESALCSRHVATIKTLPSRGGRA